MPSSTQVPSPPAARARWFPWFANLLGLAVAVWVLQPVVTRNFVWMPQPSAEQVAALRNTPEDARLSQLVAMPSLSALALPAGSEAIALADRWLAAARDPARHAPHPLVSPVGDADLDQSPEVGGLPFASLFQVDVLVRAFRASGNVRYLEAARDAVLAFARYERSAWRDHGFLWNDHAVAARMGAVIRFWALYRRSDIFAPADAAEILQHVKRSTALLARESQFTAWSNHGVMQNIGLLQVAAAFPGLVDARSTAETAVRRLSMQMRFYVSDEGVVLEHSPGYHELGRDLLAMAIELAPLSQAAVPADWQARLRKADAFLQHIRRPDGTLPAIGDTHYAEAAGAPSGRAPEAAGTAGELALYPLSGYAAWTWRTEGGTVHGQSTANWSHFPRQAHKHADEMALSTWAAGRSWITPSGYAPYSTPLRATIDGWLGSNAPHALGEAPFVVRSSTLMSSATSPVATFVEMRRLNQDGGGFRRQVVDLGGSRWLVLDVALRPDAAKAAETLWTFAPDLKLERQAGNRFRLTGTRGESMTVRLAGGPAAPRAEPLRGSREPYGGWVATTQGMVGAPAMRVLAEPQGWTATAFALGASEASEELAVEYRDADHWQAGGDGWKVRREGPSLEVAAGARSATVALQPAADTSAAHAAVDNAYTEVVGRYPRPRNLDNYRIQIGAALLLAWLVQLAAWSMARKALVRRGWLAPVMATAAATWVASGLFVELVYLAR